MKKITCLFGIMFLCCFFMLKADQTSQPFGNYSNTTLNWQPNYNNAISLAKSSSKPILILFTGTTWCPACMKLEKEVLNKPEFARSIGDRFILLKAEFSNYTADAIQNSPYKFLLDRYRVDSFPTMIVINSEGQVLFTVNYQARGGPDSYAQELLSKLSYSQNPASK